MTKRRYSIADARANLPAIVHCAESGQEVELTRHGKPVAVVVSCRELERLRGDRPSFGELYRAFVDAHPAETCGFDEDFASAARDRTTGRTVPL